MYDPDSGWTCGEMLSFGGPDLPGEQVQKYVFHLKYILFQKTRPILLDQSIYKLCKQWYFPFI